MTKTELESKHLAELHELAADAGVERYRMLPKAELIEKLAGGEGKAAAPAEEKKEVQPAAAPASSERPKRKRRRRWGRRRKGAVRVHDMLLPASGRQAVVYAESRAACTALLREVAAEVSGATDGPDPVALLIDPTPEELAEWKRDAPEAEIVSAGKAQHADDALAQASTRAAGGEDVIVLIDSLSRYAEDFGDVDGARALFATSGGSLTVIAAVERPES